LSGTLARMSESLTYADLCMREDGSNKFWRVEVHGDVVIVRWGRIGTAGRTTSKRHPGHAAATRDAERQVNAKLRKGYQLVATSGPAGPPRASGSAQADSGAAAELLVRIERLLDQGLDKKHGHPRAVELAPEPFFWDCGDELAPFGSDEGHTALGEFLGWRKKHPAAPLLDCLRWVVEDVGEMVFKRYNAELLNRAALTDLMRDPAFNDQQYVYTLDVSVFSTGFAQLVLEGTIDAEAKPVLRVALDRQRLYAEIEAERWQHAAEYIAKLRILGRVLDAA